MAAAILSDPGLLRVREQHLARLDRLFGGEQLDPVFVLAGLGGVGDLSPQDEAATWVATALDQLAVQATRAGDESIFRPLCLEAWFCGVHFVDALFGARVERAAAAPRGDTGGWWNEPLPSAIGTLQPPDWSASTAWRAAAHLARAMAGAGVTVPLFAPQVLSSPLNIAVNLHGEAFLVALHERPEAARHDLQVIADTLVTLHRWYRRQLPAAQLQPVVIGGRCQPRGFGQICGCSTHLLSAVQYEQFVAPLDAAVLGAWPRGGMIHLCGRHTQHLPTWQAMPALRAVQLNDRAADDLPAYVQGLRDDQIIYWSPTPTMSVADALRITGGRRLVIAADLPEPP